MSNNEMVMMRKFDIVCQILEKYNYDSSQLVPILQEVQEEYRYLPEEIMAFIASSLHISPARLYGVATFFTHFALQPKGKYIIKVCDGTACHVKKSEAIIDAVRRRLNLTEKNNTSFDMMFTFETVSCLGACGLAPVLVVGDEVHSSMTPEKAIAVVDDIFRKETINDQVAE
ncbi:MAG: NAD(P)H-dependent oxidoreductase subunit E [Candidatus Kapabacteria bacterium]|nr:NAD(P)H-dependent oxidoreductase subunit E [Candidatus Kapabacteria bacterium]